MTKKIFVFLLKKTRILFYKIISDKILNAKYIQPVLCKGVGCIKTGDNVSLGVERSNLFYSTYIYMDVRKLNSKIYIGNNTVINNNSSIISDGCSISIGDNCLCGVNLQIMDSNFHDLNPLTRFSGGSVDRNDVAIGNNVFIGNNVTILKGANVGDNSVIANGSIVLGNIPNNVVAGGVPAKIIRKI